MSIALVLKLSSLESSLTHALSEYFNGDMRQRGAVEQLMDELTLFMSAVDERAQGVDRAILESARELKERAVAILGEGSSASGGAAAAAASGVRSGSRRAGVVVRGILGAAAGVARPILRESYAGPQIAKPIIYLGNAASSYRLREKGVKMNFLEAGYDARLRVRGEGDCLIRSVMVGLLVDGNFAPIKRFLEEYRDRGVFRELTASQNGEFAGGPITKEAVEELLAMVERIERGDLELAQIFFPESHRFDTLFCAIFRSAIAVKLEDRTFFDGILDDATRTLLVREALQRKCYLGSIHEAALADLLGIRIAKIHVRAEEAQFDRIVEGVDGFYCMGVEVHGVEKPDEDVTLYFEGGDAGHYDILVTTNDRPKADVVRLIKVLNELQREIAYAGRRYETLKRNFERAYALTPVSQIAFDCPVLKAHVFRTRRIIDSLKAQAETLLHRSFTDLDVGVPTFARRAVHPELPAEEAYREGIIPLEGGIESEEALHRFYAEPTEETANGLLHHLNLYFSHDVRADVYTRYDGDRVHIDQRGFFDAIHRTISSYEGEKAELRNQLLGKIYTLLGSDDRGEGMAFGSNHLFESPYFFGKALQR